jgi:hypothetical protein
MNKTGRLSVEYSLYALALVLALAIRLLSLGSPALNDSEASWALQALDVAQGEQVALASQPAYVFLTGSFCLRQQ